jgi:pimeloyl-ACP methyl ester carboxylesterase
MLYKKRIPTEPNSQLKVCREGPGRMDTWIEAKTPGGLAYLSGWIGSPGEAGAPLLLLAHGTGFHAATWAPVIDVMSTLTAGPVEAVAFDWSGHGLSRPLPGTGVAAERCDWREVGPKDVDELLSTLGTGSRPVYGVGHSFGGAALVMAELSRPGTFHGLILLEPVLRAEPKEGRHPLAELALRRRAVLEVCIGVES